VAENYSLSDITSVAEISATQGLRNAKVVEKFSLAKTGTEF